MFAAATAVTWTLAFKVYTRSLGMIQTDGKPHHFNLDHVAQRLAAVPDMTLEQWLGPKGAEVATRRRAEYRGRSALTLLCGFFAVFFLGTYLDQLRNKAQGYAPPPPNSQGGAERL